MAEYAPLSEDMEPPRRIPRGRRASTVSRPIVRTSVSMVATRPTLYPSTGQPHFDLVLILPIEQDPAPGLLKLRRSIPARARHVGMECVAELSRDEDEILLMFSATDDLMETMAEQLTMEKRLEPKSERSSSKFKSHDPREDPQLSATEGYTDFRIDEKHRFEADSKLSFFSSLERIRLLQALLELPHAEGGCGFHLENLRERGVISKIVPIHADAIHEGELEVEGRQTHLMKAWVQAPMSVFACQPLDEIRDYLGERIALYFAFVETLSNALVYQAALGLLLMFISLVWYGGSHDNPFTALYSLAILLWITWFCKRWRRMEIRLASHWHVTDFEETERHRPDFQGPEEHGFYSDEGYWVEIPEDEPLRGAAPLTKRFDRSERTWRTVTSFVVVLPLMSVVVLITVAILALKSSFMLSFYIMFSEDALALTKESYGVTLGSALGGVLNGIFIVASNMVYARVAVRLNNWENHRTDTDYDDALIVKTMFFQVVNSYVAIYYIAFIKANEIDVLSWLTGTQEYCHNVQSYDESEREIEASNGGVKYRREGWNPSSLRCVPLNDRPSRPCGGSPYCLAEMSTFMTLLVCSSMLTGKVLEFVTPWIGARVAMAQEEYGLYAAKSSGGVAIKARFIASHLLASLPFCKCGAKCLRPPAEDLAPPTRYEEQAKLAPYEGVFSEYSKLIIQLGYVVLFAPAFPLASSLLWISFYFEMRTDAFKLIANTRRPLHLCAEDIGAWQKVLWMLGAVGVLTNLGLVGITETTLQRALPFSFFGLFEINSENKITFLVFVEHLLLCAQFVVVVAIPDTPEDLSKNNALAGWRERATRDVLHGKKGALVRKKWDAEDWDDETIFDSSGIRDVPGLCYAAPVPDATAPAVAGTTAAAVALPSFTPVAPAVALAPAPAPAGTSTAPASEPDV